MPRIITLNIVVVDKLSTWGADSLLDFRPQSLLYFTKKIILD